ncbi:MAG: hypothetical protein HOV86_08385 [Thermoactinospora sp.]|nr:hypothetical protein [Thermoactinospora sp.]
MCGRALSGNEPIYRHRPSRLGRCRDCVRAKHQALLLLHDVERAAHTEPPRQRHAQPPRAQIVRGGLPTLGKRRR